MLPYVLSREGFPLRANSVELEGHPVQGDRRSVAVDTCCTLVLLEQYGTLITRSLSPRIHFAKQDKRTPPPTPSTNRLAGYGE